MGYAGFSTKNFSRALFALWTWRRKGQAPAIEGMREDGIVHADSLTWFLLSCKQLSRSSEKQAESRTMESIAKRLPAIPARERPCSGGTAARRRVGDADYGPSHRVHYIGRGEVLFILLCGGGQTEPDRDILRALELALPLPNLLPA